MFYIDTWRSKQGKRLIFGLTGTQLMRITDIMFLHDFPNIQTTIYVIFENFTRDLVRERRELRGPARMVRQAPQVNG